MTDLLAVLSKKLDDNQAALEKYDRYYEGEQAVAYISPEVREMVGRRVFNVIIAWPELALDALEQRLDVEGFRLGEEPDADATVWQDWQRNGMDEESPTVHTEAMLYGYSAVSAWAHEDDDTVPVIATETPYQVAFDFDPATRARRAALKRWTDGEDSYATLELPDRLVKLRSRSSLQLPASMVAWKQYDEVPNPLGVVPMVPFRNRTRTRRLDGRSELRALIPLADVINKLATDLMVTADFHAMPLQYMTNLLLTTDPNDLERLREQVKQYVDLLPKGRTRLGGPDVKFGQLEPASLENFVGAIRMFVGFLAAIGALPPHAVGITTENPASADAIRSSETLLVKRAERKQRGFGGSWEEVQRLAAAIRLGVAVRDLPDQYHSMETVWRDAATPTVAQSADAAVKLHAAGIIDTVAAQERSGISPVARKAIADRQARAAAEAATADIEARMAFAKRMREENPELTFNASLAAVGLLAAASANAVPASAANPQ